ncbi:hypothetical protein KBB68_02715 [Candidatus Babeliales bacterium]|nr:hypothetical protein [Candidatus Babeliales bacterium]
MKQKKSVLFFLALLIQQNFSISAAAIPDASVTTTNSEMLMSVQVPQTMLDATKKLHETVASYPLRGVLDDGTVQQGISNRIIKSMPPEKTWPILSKGHFSVLRPGNQMFKNYPVGASLFPDYADLSAKFDAMIAMFEKNPNFIAFFRKVHLNVLNELYHYLMSVYVNFNLQHTGIAQNDDGSLRVDIPAFIQSEKNYAANKKTLIINHLMNVIESQFNSSIRSCVPKLPQVYASFIGKTLVHNDYSIDLTQFLDQEINSEVAAHKKIYLQGLATYLDFFQAYTAYLNQSHPKKAERQHFVAFVDIAEKINQFLYADADPTTDKALVAVAKMNPPLFSFTYDDIRALKMIPHLAKSLPAKSLKIMWPEQMVQAANEGIILHMPGQGPHPLAYFRNNLDTVVTNSSNDANLKLFMCVRNGQNLFEEQLIAEPDWLSSWDGVCKILRACFGDFSALLGLEILDPCMESLINVVLAVQNGQDPVMVQVGSNVCSNLIKIWKKSEVSAPVPQTNNFATATELPALPGLNLPSSLPVLPALSTEG